MKKVYKWVRLSDGRLMTTNERNDYLENELEFDEFTPMSEMWDYFDKLDYPIVIWTD